MEFILKACSNVDIHFVLLEFVVVFDSFPKVVLNICILDNLIVG